MTMTVRMLSAGATTILIAKPFLSREVAVMQAYWPKRTRVPSSSLKRSTRNKEKVQSKVGSACSRRQTRKRAERKKKTKR